MGRHSGVPIEHRLWGAQMPKVATFVRSRALAATLATAAACGDSTGSGGVTGTYQLKSLNGNPLPAIIIQVGNDKVEVTAGAVTLNSDNSFSFRLTIRVTEGGSVTTEEDTSVGTYAVNANSVVFTSEGQSFNASLTGNTLTFIDEGFTYLFEK
jgi:hypothetical protein